MLEFYTAPAPNGWKIAIMLEECGLPYQPHLVNLLEGEQFRADYLAKNPNGKIPTLVDRQPTGGGPAITVFESGAILLYLAEKAGRFLPEDIRGRSAVHQWLFWQVGGLGPMLGQHGHFALYAPEQIPYAVERYRRETLRLYGVLEQALSASEYVALPQYSVADMACFPWVQTYRAQGIDLDDFPRVRAWYERLKQRPALRRGMDLGRELLSARPQDHPRGRKLLYGINEGDA